MFNRDLYPVITPIAIHSPETFPLLPGLSVNLLVRLEPAPDAPQEQRFAVMPLPKTLARLIPVPDAAKYTCVLLEDMVAAFVTRFFPGEAIAECVPFRVTRNADLAVREDQAGDLLAHMREVLDARKRSNCVRLEADEPFDVDRHLIPERKGVPAHYHYDLRFMIEADPAEPLQISSESKDPAWVEVARVPELNREESMARMVRKTLAKS